MLTIDWNTSEPAPQAGQNVVIAVTEAAAASLEERFGAAVAAACANSRFRGRAGERFSFTRHEGDFLLPVTLMGVGEGLASSGSIRKVAHDAVRIANGAGSIQLVLDLDGAIEPPADGPAAAHLGSLLVQGCELGLYRYDAYRSGDDARPATLKRVSIVTAPANLSAGTERGQIIAAAVADARDLVNGPAEVVTPTFLAATAERIAAELAGAGVTCTVLERDECERRGMNLFLAVARGSAEAPKFIHLRYTPRAPSKGRICLVGKGVTFDSGGLSLKPSDAMMGMKMDMGGAAAVLGALKGAARLGVPWEVHAIVAATENMIGGKAYRLGDVLRASNGKTVEIDNTDAEGRLTLADALLYAGALRPDFTIDLATLTGACIVALGPHIAGVMSPDDGLARAWLDAALRAGEDMWRLPLPPALKELLKSPIADMRNTGDRAGGSITAGLFLSEFTAGQRWLHVDIAGPAMVKKAYGVTDEGGSGFGVATILDLLSGDI